jgi:hypothetical protein
VRPLPAIWTIVVVVTRAKLRYGGQYAVLANRYHRFWRNTARCVFVGADDFLEGTRGDQSHVRLENAGKWPG